MIGNVMDGVLGVVFFSSKVMIRGIMTALCVDDECVLLRRLDRVSKIFGAMITLRRPTVDLLPPWKDL